MSQYEKERTYAALTSGESLKILRELHDLTQAELAARAGMAQANISALENDRREMGLECAEKLAKALHVHPAVLAWPNWPVTSTRRASPRATYASRTVAFPAAAQGRVAHVGSRKRPRPGFGKKGVAIARKR